METEAFEAQIDFSDLEKKYSVQFNDNLDAALIIDGIPKIDLSKEDKLLAKLNKDIFAGRGSFKKENVFIPRNEVDQLAKGYMFIEFNTAEEASKVLKVADGYRLDKDHLFSAFKFADYESIITTPDESLEPEVQDYEPREHYKEWLMDPAGRDQFNILHEDKMELFWHQKNDGPELAYSRSNWTELLTQWSPGGSYVATFHRLGVALWAGKNFTKIAKLKHEGVRLADFSPCERYLISWSPEHGSDHNLCVWHIKTGKMLKSFFLGGQTVEWPAMKWSFDGNFVAKLASDSIFVYELPAMTLLEKKPLKIEEVKDFEWSPSQNVIAYWIPEISNNPARVTLIELPSRHILRTKNLFNVADCKLTWHERGDYLCVQVDRLNKAKKPLCTNFELFRLREKDIPVDVLECKGTIGKFAWEPSGDKFAYINLENGKNLVSFYEMDKVVNGVKQLNHIRTVERKGITSLYWSPKGRFIVLALLDSITASLEFWNTNDVELMNVVEHYMASDVMWDPTGRYVASYVSYWKQQLENGYCIWDFKGQLAVKRKVDKLLQFQWRPRPASLLSDASMKQIRKNLKDYSKEFDAADEYESSKTTRELTAKRKSILSEWKSWKAEKQAEYESCAELRISLTGAPKQDENFYTVDEWIEEVVEETEELIK